MEPEANCNMIIHMMVDYPSSVFASWPPSSRIETESWVEISSQPSSSSLSSISDEVVTAGSNLDVSLHSRQSPARIHRQSCPQRRTTHVNSQDEFDEFESEDDSFLASSKENLNIRSKPSHGIIKLPAETDKNENANALGYRVPDSPPPFRPQPNIFHHHTVPLFSSNHPHNAIRNRSRNMRTLQNHQISMPSFMGGMGEPDGDMALRASLTTLLSCAAAARDMPKDLKEPNILPARPKGGATQGNQPVELCLVQENDLLPRNPAPHQVTPRSSRRKSNSQQSTSSDIHKMKRSSLLSNHPGRSPKANKKKRTAVVEEALFSPTLLTWVVSAGVVAVVSVIGFGAGYIIGREVGKQESIGVACTGLDASSIGVEAVGCGSKIIRGSGVTWRRIRWGTDIARSVAAS